MVVPNVQVTNERLTEAARLAGEFGMERGELLEVPHVWLGTEEQISTDLMRRRERWGVSYWLVPAGDVDAAAPIVSRLMGT